MRRRLVVDSESAGIGWSHIQISQVTKDIKGVHSAGTLKRPYLLIQAAVVSTRSHVYAR